MTILVQREHYVARTDRAEFERQSREGLWPAFLHFGAKMLAYGGWSFAEYGGDGVVTHTAYENFEHWHATRANWAGKPGAFYQDGALLTETAELRAVYAHRGDLVRGSRARIIDVDEEVSRTGARYRRPQAAPADPPPTFGRGSVISERTYELHDDAAAEFRSVSRELVWPWLEDAGGRLLAYGQDPLRPPNEVITLFAFRSLTDWHRLSRPGPEESPPPEVVQGWNHRRSLIHSHRGRLLAVLTDFGTPV